MGRIFMPGANPEGVPCRGRCLHRPGGPCAAANIRGRAMALPYIAIFMRGANRGVAVMAGVRGRDESRPYE